MSDATSPTRSPQAAVSIADLERLHGAALRQYLETRFPGHGEDLAQETLVKALQHWDRVVGEESNPRAWLFRVGKNAGSDQVWKKKRPDLFPDGTIQIAEEDDGPAPLEHLLQTERAAQVRECLTKLTPAEQRLLVGRVVERESIQKLAEELSVVPRLASQRLNRAKGKLRTCMGGKD